MIAAWEAWEAGLSSAVAETLNTLLILWIVWKLTQWWGRSHKFRPWSVGIWFFWLWSWASGGDTWSWVVIHGTSIVLGHYLYKPDLLIQNISCQSCQCHFQTISEFEQHECASG